HRGPEGLRRASLGRRGDRRSHWRQSVRARRARAPQPGAGRGAHVEARRLPAVPCGGEPDEARQPPGGGGESVIRSMTGFWAAAARKGGISARVEVRSVNHRYLQVKARLPSDIAHLEPSLESAVRESLDRGSVSVSASVERDATARTARVNAEVARKYKKSLQ